MRIADLYLTLCAKTHIATQGAVGGLKRWLTTSKGAQSLAAGAALAGVSNSAMAQGLTQLLNNWRSAINEGLSFLMVVALVMGVGGILYGIKLILDKTNERADVKNGHIALSMVGGSMLCVLWFIVTVLVETTAGDASQMGQMSQTF